MYFFYPSFTKKNGSCAILNSLSINKVKFFFLKESIFTYTDICFAFCNPILDRRISICSFVRPSVTGCTEEPWSNCVLLTLENLKDSIFFLIFFGKFFILRFWDILSFFQFFSLRIGLDWKALVESRSPNIEKKNIFRIFRIFWKKMIFWDFLLIFGFFFDHFELYC